ncbi:MAG: hypothetical protein HY784_07655 [Chloroflexi bacterium]|nr:hypothetical protein [Chloroflexota bacterium]
MLKPEAWLALCVIGVLVLGVNALLFDALRGRQNSLWSVMSKAGRTARHPWGTEDAQLSELSRRVAELKAAAEGQDDRQTD